MQGKSRTLGRWHLLSFIYKRSVWGWRIYRKLHNLHQKPLRKRSFIFSRRKNLLPNWISRPMCRKSSSNLWFYRSPISQWCLVQRRLRLYWYSREFRSEMWWKLSTKKCVWWVTRNGRNEWWMLQTVQSRTMWSKSMARPKTRVTITQTSKVSVSTGIYAIQWKWNRTRNQWMSCAQCQYSQVFEWTKFQIVYFWI